MDEQNRNLILAMALSMLVLLGWFLLFPPEQQAPSVAEVPTADGVVDPGALTPPAPGTAAAPVPGAATPPTTRADAVAASARVAVDTPRLVGSINLRGGRLDDLALRDYRETLDPASPIVNLLSPTGAPGAYYAQHGWVPAGGGLGFEAVPGADAEWTLAAGDTLAPGAPVTLSWEGPTGLVFEREIAVDEDFMFSVTQRVRNATGAAVRLAPYGLVARHGEPDTVNFFILHEGVIAKVDGTLEELDYDDVADLAPVAAERGRVEIAEVTTGGWIGFTDKYWMTTLVPDAGPFQAVTKYVDGADIFQTETRMPAVEVAPGAVAETTSRLFAGAKEWEVIRDYEAGRPLDGFADHVLYTFGLIDQAPGAIDRFVDSIDWGWFYSLTKPIFMMLHGLDDVIGNMGLAIIVLTLIIKAVLLPLAYKSYVSMARMKELQPEMEKLKERAGDDRQKLQQGMMALYRDNKVNPAAGCLPILMQIPIFFSLYKVIFVTIDLRHAPFFGPFQDLSAPDPTSIINLFGLLPWGVPEPGSILALIFIGILPLLLGISMWLQQKLNPTPTDPTQAMIFAWLPWVFMFMLGGFASGLVVYWIANNTITFIQQYSIMWSQGMRPDLLGNIRGKTKPPAPVSKPANAPDAPPEAAPGDDAPGAPEAANRPGPSPKRRRPRSKR